VKRLLTLSLLFSLSLPVLATQGAHPRIGLVLSGGGSKVRGLKQYLADETGLEVVIFNPFANMKLNKKKIDQEYLEAIAPEMAIAAGLAIRSAEF